MKNETKKKGAHQRAQKATISSKSSIVKLFKSRSSLDISFLKRQATLKAIEAFCISPIPDSNFPLRKVVRAISFLCAFGSTDQISSASLIIALRDVKKVFSDLVKWKDLHRLLISAQANQVFGNLMSDIYSVKIPLTNCFSHVVPCSTVVTETLLPLALHSPEVAKSI